MVCQGDLRSVNSSLVSWLTMQELEQDSVKKGIHTKCKQSRQKEKHCLTEGVLTKDKFQSNVQCIKIGYKCR